MLWVGEQKEKRWEGVNALSVLKHRGCLPVLGKAASHAARTEEEEEASSLRDALRKVPQCKPSPAGAAGGEVAGEIRAQGDLQKHCCPLPVSLLTLVCPPPFTFTCPHPSLPWVPPTQETKNLGPWGLIVL